VTTLAVLQTLVAQGESETLELERSTAELKRAGETLCAFPNGEGGKVPIGVAPDGRLVGQEVADITLRDIAAMLGRFERPARVEMSRVDVGSGRQVIVLEAVPSRQFAPFVFESKPYKRVGSTTTVMSQEEYARLLLDRNHSRHRWENQPAVDVRLEDLDREEILRTRSTAIEQRRLSAGTSMDVGDILDRLGLRIDGQVTQAAQMLYGTKFLPDYPQALLKLGRFRGTKITGDILDNKQEYLHAFAAIAWLDRTLPLSARFPKGAINREDRLPVPAEALREIVINAVIHRDVSNPSSYVAIAVFDDRIEIHSIGDFPMGIRAELLTQEHRSIPRNPLIAGAFHRTGAIEVWGRGTNRVVEACVAHGIAEPTFAEASGAVTVTFKAEVVVGPRDLVPGGHQVGTKSALSPHQVQVLDLACVPRALAELMVPSGRTDRTKFRDQVLAPLLEAGLLAMTIPSKPRSSKQQYRTTDAGRAALATTRKA
jgi:ATP-dependent DNA helicase RecG